MKLNFGFIDSTSKASRGYAPLRLVNGLPINTEKMNEKQVIIGYWM